MSPPVQQQQQQQQPQLLRSLDGAPVLDDDPALWAFLSPATYTPVTSMAPTMSDVALPPPPPFMVLAPAIDGSGVLPPMPPPTEWLYSHNPSWTHTSTTAAAVPVSAVTSMAVPHTQAPIKPSLEALFLAHDQNHADLFAGFFAQQQQLQLQLQQLQQLQQQSQQHGETWTGGMLAPGTLLPDSAFLAPTPMPTTRDRSRSINSARSTRSTSSHRFSPTLSAVASGPYSVSHSPHSRSGHHHHHSPAVSMCGTTTNNRDSPSVSGLGDGGTTSTSSKSKKRRSKVADLTDRLRSTLRRFRLYPKHTSASPTLHEPVSPTSFTRPSPDPLAAPEPLDPAAVSPSVFSSPPTTRRFRSISAGQAFEFTMPSVKDVTTEDDTRTAASTMASRLSSRRGSASSVSAASMWSFSSLSSLSLGAPATAPPPLPPHMSAADMSQQQNQHLHPGWAAPSPDFSGLDASVQPSMLGKPAAAYDAVAGDNRTHLMMGTPLMASADVALPPAPALMQRFDSATAMDVDSPAPMPSASSSSIAGQKRSTSLINGPSAAPRHKVLGALSFHSLLDVIPGSEPNTPSKGLNTRAQLAPHAAVANGRMDPPPSAAAPVLEPWPLLDVDQAAALLSPAVHRVAGKSPSSHDLMDAFHDSQFMGNAYDTSLQAVKAAATAAAAHLESLGDGTLPSMTLMPMGERACAPLVGYSGTDLFEQLMGGRDVGLPQVQTLPPRPTGMPSPYDVFSTMDPRMSHHPMEAFTGASATTSVAAAFTTAAPPPLPPTLFAAPPTSSNPAHTYPTPSYITTTTIPFGYPTPLAPTPQQFLVGLGHSQPLQPLVPPGPSCGPGSAHASPPWYQHHAVDVLNPHQYAYVSPPSLVASAFSTPGTSSTAPPACAPSVPSSSQAFPALFLGPLDR